MHHDSVIAKPVRCVTAAVLLMCNLVPAARAQDTCGDALIIHNYPVLEASSYAPLFEAVEGYRPGDSGERPWPFASDDSVSYPVRSFCPLDAEDRVVRLFEIPMEDLETSDEFLPGTLTLVARDLAAARDSALRLAVEEPRDQTVGGRSSFYFQDKAGNEFFIWEYPGPPGQ